MRAAAMLPACLCLLVLCLGLASADKKFITKFVVPQEAKIGDDVELICQYELNEPETSLFYVKWWWAPIGSPTDSRKLIYQRIGKNQGQLSHEGLVINDNDTIALVELEPNDSGTYFCEVSNIDEEWKSQELIVYTPGELSLNLTMVKDGDDDEDVLVTCEAIDVAPEPELVISINGNIVSLTEIIISGPIDGLFDIVANATLEEIEVDSTVTCELFYKNTKVKHVPFIATEMFKGSGAELTTTDNPEDSTEWETTTATLDGSSMVLSSTLLLLATAALVQLLSC